MILRFRAGRHLGRTVYVQSGMEPDRDADEMIGCMDTPELGRIVVAALDLYDNQSGRNHARLQAALDELRRQRQP